MENPVVGLPPNALDLLLDTVFLVNVDGRITIKRLAHAGRSNPRILPFRPHYSTFILSVEEAHLAARYACADAVQATYRAHPWLSRSPSSRRVHRWTEQADAHGTAYRQYEPCAEAIQRDQTVEADGFSVHGKTRGAPCRAPYKPRATLRCTLKRPQRLSGPVEIALCRLSKFPLLSGGLRIQVTGRIAVFILR